MNFGVRIDEVRRKPECTVVHEDFRIKRNAEITLLGHLPKKSGLAKRPPFLLLYPAVVILQLQWMLS